MADKDKYEMLKMRERMNLMNCHDAERKERIEIWGRLNTINVVFDLFPDEEITKQQLETYSKFMERKDDIFQQAFEELKEYCLDNYSEEIKGKSDNIYAYIIPKAIYICRSKNENRIAGLFCKFRYDRENDLVVLVENESVSRIGTQDIIL